MKTVSEIGHVPQRRERADNRGDAELARKLNELRVQHGLSVHAVGAYTGMSTGTAYNIHAGTRAAPSIVFLARLAAFYEVSLDYLAGHMVEAAREGRL